MNPDVLGVNLFAGSRLNSPPAEYPHAVRGNPSHHKTVIPTGGRGVHEKIIGGWILLMMG